MAQTVDEIAELLNKMREDNERSKDTIEKTLTSIDNRLEFIEDDDEAEELIKMYIADLKKSVDNKYSDATVKLEKIKSHFDEILNKQADVALRKDVESLSETFFLNTSAITSDLAEQKKALEYLKGHLIEIQESSYNKGEIENLFKEFKTNLISLNSGIDKALGQTVDVLRNINITDTINEINGNFSNISLELKKVPAQIAKNDERFRQMLSLLNEKVDVIATYSSNSEILDDLNGQVTEITSALETLKSFISETYDSTDNYFREKFSQLENEFSSIVTDSDFSKFRTDLGDFVQKIIDNSAALNSELSYSTERIESILTTVKSLDFRDDFENIVSRIVELKDVLEDGIRTNHQNIASSIIELSEKFNDSYEKQDERRREIYSDLKNDLESITEILKNISGDNLTEIVNTLEDKTNRISEIVSSINENSDNNYNRIINNFDDIKENIGQVSSDISDLQVEFKNTAYENSDKIISEIADIKNTAHENSDRIISEISDIKNTAHENSDKIISEISNITNAINENNEPSEKLLWEISNISSEVSDLRDEFRQSSVADFENSSKIVDEIYNISDRIVDLRTTINETPKFDIDEVKNVIEDLSEKLSNDLARQRELFANQSSDIEKLESLNTLFEDIKNIENVLHEQSDLFKNSLDENIAGVKNYIDEINEKLNSSGFEIGNLQNIPEDIKNLEQTLEQQTQSIQTSVVEANDSIKNYIGEIRYLIESNDNSAENFQALNQNMQNLENAVNQQFNVFENSFNESLAGIRNYIDEINEKLNNSGFEIGNLQNIPEDIKNLEQTLEQQTQSIQTSVVEANDSVKNYISEIHYLIENIKNDDSSQTTLQALSGNMQSLESAVNEQFYVFENSFNESLAGIRNYIDEINEKLNNSGFEIGNLQNIPEDIKNLEQTLEQQTQSIQTSVVEANDSIKNYISEIHYLIENIKNDDSSQTTLQALSGNMQSLESAVNEQFYVFENSFNESLAGIRSYIDEINEKLNNSGFEIGNLQNIPEDIKNLEQTLEQQTQSIQTSVVEANDSIKNYIGEIRYLIENTNNDNSDENFQAINENIHSLENILIQQSNGLQNSISEHIAELKENFSEINSSFENSRLENYEKISAKLNEIEELNRSYETSVSTLNFSLAEVLQSISNIRENNTELNNSVNNVVDSINHLISRISDEEDRYSEVSSVITALLEMTAKKEDIADIDKRLDSFDYTENLQQISDRIDTLSSIFETSSRTNFENLSEKIGGISQVISDFQNVLENQTEINSLNLTNHFEKFRENLSNILTVDDFAAFKTNFEEFVQNIINNTDIANANSETIKNEIAKLFEKLDNINFNEGFEDVNNNIASINLTIDNLASEVRTLSDLSTQKYSEVLDNISLELQKTAGEISDKISSDNELNFGDIKGNIDNISSQIYDLKNDLTSSHDSSLFALSARFDTLTTNIEDITNSINSLSSLFENKSDNNVNQIIDNIREITAQIEELKYGLDQSDYVNKILDTVNELTIKVDNLADNEDLKEKISSIKDAVMLLSSDIKMSQEEYTDILRVNNEEQLNNLSNISANVESIKYHIDDTVESLRNYIEELDNISKASSVMAENAVSEKLIDLQTVLSDNSNLFEQKFTDLGVKLQEFAHIVENSNSDTEGKISASLDEIAAIKDELLSLDNILKSFKLSNDEKLNETTSVLDAGIENIVYSINSINDNINNGVENSLKDGIASLDEKFAEISGILTNIKEEFSYNDAFIDISDKVLSLRDEMKLISTDIMHISEMKAEEIISAFEPVKEVMKEFTNFELDKVLSDLRSQIELSFMNLGADVNGEIASNGESLNRLEQAYKETYEKISSIEECVSEKFREDIELLNTTFEKGIVDLRYGFEDKFEDKINDIKAYFDIAFNDSKIYDSIDSFKNNLDEIDDKIQDSISSVKNDLDEINTKLDIAVANSNQDALQESLQLKFNDLTDSNTQISEKLDILALNDNDEELQSRFDDLEDCIDDYSEHISAQIASIDDKIDVLVADDSNEEINLKLDNIKEYIDDYNKNISAQIDTIDSKIDIVATDASNEELNLKLDDIKDYINGYNTNISTQIDTINNKIDIVATDNSGEELQSRFDDLEDCIDDYSEHISAQIASIDDKIDVLVADDSNEETQLRFDEMFELHNKISEILSTLNEKVTTIANDDTKTEIVAEVNSIKNILFEQKKFFEDNTNEKYLEIDKYLKDVLSKLDNVDIDKNTEDIKDSVMQAIVSLTDQISFIEETEEIKDFVEEKTDKLNDRITEVQKQLKQLTNPDDGFNYTYTLQDVESDIARLRMSINNMSNSDFDDLNDEIKKITNSIENLESSLTQEQITDLKDDIEKLSEEIVSISSRTNKLLLNSDESYKALNDGLNSFSDTIYKLEDRINYLDNTEINERLERKIDNIQSLASASTNADKVFHQAMMYLGEWVDATTENISSISDKISQIQNFKNLIPNKNDIVNDVVSDIKNYTDETVFDTIREMIPDNTEIIDNLEKKFVRQEERIENLENKIEQILSILEEKDDMILNRKVDKIEKMLSGLNANIEKLTSYVEE